MAAESLSATPASLVGELRNYIELAAQASGSTKALKPGHRVKFHWPPHPISYDFHVLASEWTGRATLDAEGESFDVQVARTPHGVFGRCEALWLESRGDDEAGMLRNMACASEPLFARQRTISRTLALDNRFTGHLRDLRPIDLLKLLYCADRDVASDASIEIETHARSGLFTPALIEILRDSRHPMRRSAQWCVLDLFEGLPSFCVEPDQERQAVEAIRDLIWNAEDDFARTTFKAGVVLGGHIPHVDNGRMLLECLDSPSKIGRRAAIHGLFHVVEWMPEMRNEVLDALRALAKCDPEPQLRDYAAGMADDVEADRMDHVLEPTFDDEF